MGMGTVLTLNIGWLQIVFDVFPEIPTTLIINFCSRFSSRKQQLALVRVGAAMIKKGIQVDEIGVF